MSCHSVAVVLTLVTNRNKYTNINKTVQKHSKNKYTYYQNTYTIVKTLTHIHTRYDTLHTSDRYKTHTYTHPHITNPTHAHTHTLQNPHMHTRHTLKNPHIHTPTH